MHCVRYAAGLTVAVVVGLLAGCGGSGPKRYPVSGTVKYKGEPVKAGTITFRGDGGMGSATITDGKYSLSSENGLPAGSYKVAVSSPDLRGVSGEGKAKALAPDLIPAKYNTKTELTADVKPEGNNEVDFDLK